MDYTELNRLKRFLLPAGGFFLLVLSILMLAGGICCITMGGSYATVSSVICFFCAVVFLVFGGSEFFIFRRLIRTLRESGELPMLLADFSRGKRVLNDRLILGTTWAIGRHSGYLAKYSDIESTYQNIIRNKGTEASRTLMVKRRGENAPRVLCTLLPGGKSDEELTDILVYFSERNPKIKFSYEDSIRVAKIINGRNP